MVMIVSASVTAGLPQKASAQQVSAPPSSQTPDDLQKQLEQIKQQYAATNRSVQTAMPKGSSSYVLPFFLESVTPLHK
jgi:hypothetical protein